MANVDLPIHDFEARLEENIKNEKRAFQSYKEQENHIDSNETQIAFNGPP